MNTATKITDEEIKSKLPKLSDVVISMMKGLVDFESTPKRKIAMGTFGSEYDTEEWFDHPYHGMCFGCCATGVVLECWPELPVEADTRYKEAKPNELDRIYQNPLSNFEDRIDSARGGNFRPLCEYYEIVYEQLPSELHDLMDAIYMSTEDWYEAFPKLCKIAKKLRELGL